jgi:hypothetical protein
MSNNLTKSKSKNSNSNSKDNSKSFIDSILEYESVVIFGGLGVSIIGTIILTGMFQSGPAQRDSVIFNAAGALCMGVGFIYLILTFMGSKVTIYGEKIDVGMLIYIIIVLFIMFVLGN